MLETKSETQRERIRERLAVHTDVYEVREDGVTIEGYISFDAMQEIVDYLKTNN